MGTVTKEREQAVVRVALHEIERLLADAGKAGVPVDGWLEQVAGELRAALPELDPEAAARIARRMLENPRRSVDAQARLALSSLAALKT